MVNKQKNRQINWIWIVEYLFVIAIILGCIYGGFRLNKTDIAQVPLCYGSGGDMTTNMVTIKNMGEQGWIYKNPLLGAPYTAEYYDAVTMELVLSAMEQILVWITGNWVLAFNLFYILGYVLAGVTALYALKALKIDGRIAAPLSVLYSFLPYHFMRGTSHIYLGMYFMVPIMVLYLMRLAQGEAIFVPGEKGYWTRSNLCRGLCLMVMALTGIYYAFFFCFFLCVVLADQLLNRENRACIKQEILSILIVVGTLILGAIPNLIYFMQHGRVETAAKGGEGVEYYGLKIIQLLLPIKNHRFLLFAKLRNLYDEAYPLVTENSSASLGLVMAIGFCILCVLIFLRRKSDLCVLKKAAILNLAAVLFGTVGGFCVIPSFVFASVRCYNRFSVFIAMFSLYAVAVTVELMVKHFAKKNWMKVVLPVGMCGIMCFGIWDQFMTISADYHQYSATQFAQDQAYVKGIEETGDIWVYQWPSMKYPENGGVNQLPDYGHFNLYLHSEVIHWSYGISEGRQGDEWRKIVAALPYNQQLQEIKNNGFQGVSVDWRAYSEEEREYIQQLLEEYGEGVVHHEDGTRSYYHFAE